MGLREPAVSGEPAGFCEAVWPLVDREVRAIYYWMLVQPHRDDADKLTKSFVDDVFQRPQPASANK